MSYNNLNVEQVEDFLTQPDCVVLDYRDVTSHRAEHLPGAKLVDDSLILEIRRKKRHAPVLVYCYHGNSSRDLSALLVSLGLSNVYNLEGGWQAWQGFQTNRNNEISRGLKNWLSFYGFDPDNINSRINNGMTPLMHAAMLAEQLYLDEIIKLGAYLGAVNDDGNNALWFACVSECIGCIHSLIKQGIMIDNRNANGATCLIYAASSGKYKVVKLLVEAGADIRQATLDGFTALDSASTFEILKFLKSQYIAA